MTENDLLRKLLEAAPYALPHMRIFRRQVLDVEAVGRDGRHFRVHAAAKGQADAYALLRGGRCIEIETKARRGKLSDTQLAWQAFCLAWEIPHLVLREQKNETPDETVTRWLTELRAIAPGPTP